MINKFIKKLGLSFFLIYIFNFIGINFNIIIPINIITLIVVYFYDLLGIIFLIITLIVLF